jgi:hypothetical protein
MTPEIISVIAVFACAFNRPTWKNIQTLMLGAILCRGARRITSVLRVMNLRNVYEITLTTSAHLVIILSSSCPDRIFEKCSMDLGTPALFRSISGTACPTSLNNFMRI